MEPTLFGLGREERPFDPVFEATVFEATVFEDAVFETAVFEAAGDRRPEAVEERRLVRAPVSLAGLDSLESRGSLETEVSFELFDAFDERLVFEPPTLRSVLSVSDETGVSVSAPSAMWSLRPSLGVRVGPTPMMDCPRQDLIGIS